MKPIVAPGTPIAVVAPSHAYNPEQLNAGLNRWEQIKKFTILGSDLSIENGELTPSLKVKRKVVTERYKKELDAHYA